MSDTLDACNGITRRHVLFTAAAASGSLLLPPVHGATVEKVPAVQRGGLDLDRFVEDCIAASRESDPQAAVVEVLTRAVEQPQVALKAVGEPTEAGMKVYHRSSTLTIFRAAWTPRMNLVPHNHLMWACIGIYTGREDNILWQESNMGLEAYGATALFAGDVAAFPDTTIHSVTNPLPRFTGGIHIYGGDFFDTTRSQWNAETLAEEPSDGAVIRAFFERENDRQRQLNKY